MKKTKIICSIGPSSCNVEVMSKMVKNGMNVARINFSHATDEEKRSVVETVKKVRELTEENIAILYDTKGPEFRNDDLENGEIKLVKGNEIKVVKEHILGNEEKFSVNYPSAIDSLKVGNIILLENGLMSIKVTEISEDGVTCVVQNGGTLGNKKSLNVPGVHLDMPFISEQDKNDILYAASHDGDFLALSFVSTKEDVLAVRELLKENNLETLKIISKIENTTGIKNLEEIVEVSDGIMVARGDLGVEAPMEDLPILQKQIIDACHKKGKFCIVATEMLESMKKNSRPTRAEVSDIANAIIDGTDAIMLSGETTTGKYPAEAVKYMSKISANIEKHLPYSINIEHINKTIEGAIATNVVETANLLNAKLIVATTISGLTAARVSNLRPKCLILATCTTPKVARGLMLNWAVYPVVTKTFKSTDEIINDAREKAIEFKNLNKEDVIAITGGLYSNASKKHTNFMKIEVI